MELLVIGRKKNVRVRKIRGRKAYVQERIVPTPGGHERISGKVNIRR